jgi:DNA-binding ferritin-like protein
MSLGNIDLIRQDFLKERFVKELESVEKDLNLCLELMDGDEDGNEDGDEEETGVQRMQKRVHQLRTIINEYGDQSLKIKKDYKEKNKTLNDELDELTRMVYKKPWNRLPEYHKVSKIKEYVKRLTDNKKVIKELEIKLTIMVEDKKLNTKKHVEYDHKECIIKKINILEFNKEDDTYTFTSGKKKKRVTKNKTTGKNGKRKKNVVK